MPEIETTTEFAGDMAALVLMGLCCLPLGFVYYLTNEEKRLVCPECRETVDLDANTCPHCRTRLQDEPDS